VRSRVDLTAVIDQMRVVSDAALWACTLLASVEERSKQWPECVGWR
jgi:hypothetical protein